MFGSKSRRTEPSAVPSKAATGSPIDGLDFEAIVAQRSYRSEKIAWILVAIFAFITMLSVAAIFALMPLKTTIPYYIYVDKESGATQAVVVADKANITTNEALVRYWVARYVAARERYVYRLQQEDYNLVMATSVPNVAKEYSSAFEGSSSKVEVLKDNAEERIQILSVQVAPGTTGRATVRYQKIGWRVGMREPESVKTYGADVAFDFIDVAGWTTRDLLLNPVGFAVTAYRTTQELR